MIDQDTRDLDATWGASRAMTPPPPMVPPHRPDDCARVVIECCAPKARQRLEEACARGVNPLLAVTSAVEVWDYLRQLH